MISNLLNSLLLSLLNFGALRGYSHIGLLIINILDWAVLAWFSKLRGVAYNIVLIAKSLMVPHTDSALRGLIFVLLVVWVSYPTVTSANALRIDV